MRLIDADALYMDIIHRFDYCDDFLEMLESAPTAQPEYSEYEELDFVKEHERIPVTLTVQPQRWIPCSERLPEKENEEQRRNWYLTTNAYGNVSLTKYEFDGDFGFIGWGTHRPVDIRIIAWLPLPEPYRGGGAVMSKRTLNCPNCGADMRERRTDE